MSGLRGGQQTAPVTRDVSVLRRLLLVAGIIEIAVGLAHFAMPHFANQSDGFAQLRTGESDFFTLVTFAVGILLIGFGCMTLVFAKDPVSAINVLLLYVIIKSVLWTARVLLELTYPVTLKLFGVQPFTALASPGLVAVLAIFVACIFYAKRIARIPRTNLGADPGATAERSVASELAA